MIYVELFFGFLKAGCFSFGGAYGAVPLIRDIVLGYGWMTDEELTYLIAVSESTPGPIMVNLATYIGSIQAGFLGSILATFAVVLPSFLIILLVTILWKTAGKHPYVSAVFQGLKPCITGIILATGVYMAVAHCRAGQQWEASSAAITVFLAAAMYAVRRRTGKNLSPIQLILLSGIAGILVYGV